METSKLHPFERAGLGKAPFRFVGYAYSVGPIRTVLPDGIVYEVGAPGQPMGTCAYCAQGIAHIYRVRSADGREFGVGSDCVAKCDADPKLVKAVDTEVKKRERQARQARVERRKLGLDATLADPDVRTKLASVPHPRGFSDRETGRKLTLLDWCEWMLAHSGDRGRRTVEKKIAEVLS